MEKSWCSPGVRNGKYFSLNVKGQKRGKHMNWGGGGNYTLERISNTGNIRLFSSVCMYMFGFDSLSDSY